MCHAVQACAGLLHKLMDCLPLSPPDFLAQAARFAVALFQLSPCKVTNYDAHYVDYFNKVTQLRNAGADAVLVSSAWPGQLPLLFPQYPTTVMVRCACELVFHYSGPVAKATPPLSWKSVYAI